MGTKCWGFLIKNDNVDCPLVRIHEMISETGHQPRLYRASAVNNLWSPAKFVYGGNWFPNSCQRIVEVLLSALPARLRTDDTKAYIRMDCKRGNPVSALGVGGNGLWKTKMINPSKGAF